MNPSGDSSHNSHNSSGGSSNNNNNSRHDSSNASIYTASTAQSSSIFSRSQASTVPSSTFSSRSSKGIPPTNLLRIPGNNDYEPAPPEDLIQQQQQYLQGAPIPYKTISAATAAAGITASSSATLSSSPSNISRRSNVRFGTSVMPDTISNPQPISIPLQQELQQQHHHTHQPHSPSTLSKTSNSSAYPVAGGAGPSSSSYGSGLPRIPETTASSPSLAPPSHHQTHASATRGTPQSSLSSSSISTSSNSSRPFPPISPITHDQASNLTPSLAHSNPNRHLNSNRSNAGQAAINNPILQHGNAQQPPLPPQPPAPEDQTNYQSSLSIINFLQRLAETLTSYQANANNPHGSGVSFLRIVLDMDRTMAEALRSTTLQNVEPGIISVNTESALETIIRVVMHFVDNFFVEPNMSTRRATLLNQLYKLGVLLKILEPYEGVTTQPEIFAVPSSPDEIPGLTRMTTIMQLMEHHRSEATMDQEGCFIAPVLRGLAPEFAVLSYYFGFPSLQQEHRQAMISLSDSFGQDAHFFCKQNYIRAAATTDFNGFTAPFRVPKDPSAPPISMSISTASPHTKVSGTLGGYIFPKVDPSQKELASFSRSTYAITCAHVCLGNSKETYPRVSIPSTFMINLFQKLLAQERGRYSPGTLEHNAYTKAISEVQSRYFSNNTSNGDSFGQVAWGEREVVNGCLSDIVIIKCNDKLKCRNYLGDDISFTQYDTGLRFGYLFVKSVIRTLSPGMEVFKYGSTTKYTSGILNGPRIIYWSEGKLQSSEFVVASGGPFAKGGDSGAWILHKNQGGTNNNGIVDGPSLGVVGMLHSYDGERREFGLFTPMARILDRLEEVTGTQWGVVGIPEKGDDSVSDFSDTSDEGNERTSDYERNISHGKTIN